MWIYLQRILYCMYKILVDVISKNLKIKLFLFWEYVYDLVKITGCLRPRQNRFGGCLRPRQNHWMPTTSSKSWFPMTYPRLHGLRLPITYTDALGPSRPVGLRILTSRLPPRMSSHPSHPCRKSVATSSRTRRTPLMLRESLTETTGS